jgi:sulfide:quinone oxidoreductase
MDIYLEKNWGPPYYKFKKTFKNPDGNDQGLLAKILPKKTHHA